MFYVIGLGNPGEKYQRTRHNVGRMVLQEKFGSDWSKNKHANALYYKGMVAENYVEYVVPETFMNRSGETVDFLVKRRGAKIEEIIVVHDDVDLPFGEVKITKSRGAGGNNGVKSIIDRLGTKDFIRIRVGIAPKSFWTGKMKRPAGGGPLERFVLKPFNTNEVKQLSEVFKKVQEAIELVVLQGVEAAMNKVN